MNKSIKTLLFLLIVIVSIEIICRYFGLHNYPLFKVDKRFEYIHEANQDVIIYGNHFRTNEYSMRSDRINKNDTLVVLLIGDSILNGGNQVDQDELASSIIQKHLQADTKKNIKVLNVSSYSWGPENIYQYLKHYGVFNADLVVMVNNSGDAYDHMTFGRVIGNSIGKPNKNYLFGIQKLMEKMLLLIDEKYEKKEIENVNTLDSIDIGFKHLTNLFQNKKIPFFVYMHADKSELVTQTYDKRGEVVLDFFKNHQIKVLTDLTNENTGGNYLDEVHFNAQGQRLMADILYPEIHQYFK